MPDLQKSIASRVSTVHIIPDRQTKIDLFEYSTLPEM
jgi:hypothetical protein